MSESTIIVDKNDTIIGHKPRHEIDYDRDIYRVSALRIINSKGEILLAQRAFAKKHDPGLRGPAVAGTNAKGETYETNILKETKEELGLENIEISQGPKRFINDGHKYYGQRFIATIDLPIDKFVLQENEVAQVKWFYPSDIRNLFQKTPEIFIPSFKNITELFLK